MNTKIKRFKRWYMRYFDRLDILGLVLFAALFVYFKLLR